MRLWIAAGVTSTGMLLAILGWNQSHEKAPDHEPKASATDNPNEKASATDKPNEPKASATDNPNEPKASATDNSINPDNLIEVVDVEAELSQATPLPPQPLPFVRFDEPPYVTPIPKPTDENVVQVEFEEPARLPNKNPSRIVDGVPLGTPDDPY